MIDNRTYLILLRGLPDIMDDSDFQNSPGGLSDLSESIFLQSFSVQASFKKHSHVRPQHDLGRMVGQIKRGRCSTSGRIEF